MYTSGVVKLYLPFVGPYAGILFITTESFRLGTAQVTTILISNLCDYTMSHWKRLRIIDSYAV